MIIRLPTLLMLVFGSCVKGYDILTARGDTIKNKAVKLVCKSDKIGSLVSFTSNSGSAIAACIDSKKCMSRNGYVITQNIRKQETYLTIPFCNKSVEGTWHCFHKTNAQYKLSCTDPPKTVVITKQTGNKIKCISDCSDVVVSFRFEVLEVDSMAILHNSTIKAAAEPSRKCTEESQRAYSASYEALYDQVRDNAVKIRCYAIAKAITESENIPNANITLTSVEFNRQSVILIAIMASLLAVLFVMFLIQIKRIHSKDDRGLTVISTMFVLVQTLTLVYGMFLLELTSDCQSSIGVDYDDLPTLMTAITASLFILACMVFLAVLKRTYLSKKWENKLTYNDILRIKISTVKMIASIAVLLFVMILVRLKCDCRSASTNSVDNDSQPTIITSVITPLFVVACTMIQMRLNCLRPSKSSNYDRRPIIISTVITIATIFVLICVMFLVRLKCDRHSHNSEYAADRILSIIFIALAVIMVCFVAAMSKTQLKCIQQSRRSNARTTDVTSRRYLDVAVRTKQIQRTDLTAA